jgi:outer membrane receptor protein involved in Fe transport
VNVGEFGYVFPEQPNVPYTTNPPRHDLSSGADSGAGWQNAAGNTGPFVLSRGKPQAYATMTYFLPTEKGSHDLKVGFEFMNDRSTNTANGTSGPILYQDRDGKTSQVRITDYGDPATFGSGWTQSSDYDRHYTLYGQDRWTLTNRMTLTAGLRYDYQRPYYSAAVRTPLITSVFSPTTVPGATLTTFNNIAPRLGVSWDASGNGTSVIKAFYGRYYFNTADNFANADPGGPNYGDYLFNDQNGNRLFDGLAELGTRVAATGGASTKLDPNLKNSYADEIDLSYDRQFWGESAFRIAYVRKMDRNLYTTVNTARIGQYTVPVVKPVDIQDTVNGITSPQQSFTVFDIPASLKGVVNNLIMNIPDSLGGSSWTYDTIELAFNKRFGAGLFLNSNFDYQWRKDLRNPSASNSNLSSDPIGTIGGAGTIFFAQVYSTSPLQSTTVWDAKASARYQFKYEIGVAANYSAQAGWPYARTINVSLPNSGSNTFFSQDLSNNRADTISLLNLRLDKGITISRFKITAMFDLFNVLNTNAVTNFNIANGSRFNQINATVDPRTAQVSFRLEF